MNLKEMIELGTFFSFLDKETINLWEINRSIELGILRKKSKQDLGLANKLVKSYKICLYWLLSLWIL